MRIVRGGVVSVWSAPLPGSHARDLGLYAPYLIDHTSNQDEWFNRDGHLAGGILESVTAWEWSQSMQEEDDES